MSAMRRCVWAQYVIRDGLSRLVGFNADYPVAHDIEPHKPLKWPPQTTRVPYEFVVPQEGDKLLDQIAGSVFNIVEDICSTSCPIEALRTYDSSTTASRVIHTTTPETAA